LRSFSLPGEALKKATEYLEHAAECRKLARAAGNAEQKAALEKMAQTWEGLAEERQRRVRIAALVGSDPKE